jgi:nitrogen fixation/metabolism regulation signal transduction histidine kinase
MTHDRRVTLLTLAAGLPALALVVVLLWAGNYSTLVTATSLILAGGAWVALTLLVRDRVLRPLQTIANLLAALREGDFSVRARETPGSDPLAHVMLEINTLAETLRVQRLSVQEATALLRSVMAEINVAIFAFDGDHRLVLVNRAGERLLGRDAMSLMGLPADALGLLTALGGSSSIQELSFPGGTGRWETRRTTFWQGGARHELLVLSDLSQPLRDQEREAWRRLIRVIGHELNNSLAPIKSIAGSLESLLGRDPPPEDWRDDMLRGLGIVAARADALSRFTSAYARLARLPQPTRKPLAFGPLMQRVVGLDPRLPIRLDGCLETTVLADADQLEQLLINLLRNATDAALETGGGVEARWTTQDDMLVVHVDDEGPGLQSTSNLFVPFFTTKPGGSGIGLALSRQIAEGHGGTLTLENRTDRRGTRATLRVPIDAGR